MNLSHDAFFAIFYSSGFRRNFYFRSTEEGVTLFALNRSRRLQSAQKSNNATRTTTFLLTYSNTNH